MSLKKDLTYIGLTKIWAEGQGVDRTSKRALTVHILRRAWENIRRSPVTASLTTITISISLFLLGLFILIVQNTGAAVSTHSGRVLVTMFLTDLEGAPKIEEIRREVVSKLESAHVSAEAVTVKTKSDALATFRSALGDEKDLLEGVDADNPLPASVEIEVSTPSEAESIHSELSKAFDKDPRVETIRYSRGAVDQLRRLLHVVEFGGGLGVAFLLVITGFIIANTIKLALYSHRTEVEIMQLVGATRSSIFAPYIIEGGAQGIFGACFSVLGVFFVYLFLSDSMQSAELLQFLFPSFSFLSAGYLFIILIMGAVVGMIGSFFAVRRYITEE